MQRKIQSQSHASRGKRPEKWALGEAEDSRPPSLFQKMFPQALVGSEFLEAWKAPRSPVMIPEPSSRSSSQFYFLGSSAVNMCSQVWLRRGETEVSPCLS